MSDDARERLPWAVLGATATGKSALAIRLAEALGGEVVNFDASSLHRGLDVGTAKPLHEERARVPHHLLDLLEPDERPSLADWVQRAEALLPEILGRGRVPVLVGGTGLYLRGLLHGVPDSSHDEALRERLEGREQRRPGSLHRLLRRLDPETAAQLPEQNVRRIVRALEHRMLTGRPLSDERSWQEPPRWRCRKIGLRLDRERRERRIRARLDVMLEQGWLTEVQGLLDRSLSADAPAWRALGYSELAAHLRGELGLAEAKEAIIIRTRQYAKRQDTWLKKEPEVEWFEAPETEAELEGLVEGLTS
ncbi:MAG: tRNA (adenosine(37)-N6)-dimethylallyltransferase MiaA [Acidobacteriota bacterium]